MQDNLSFHFYGMNIWSFQLVLRPSCLLFIVQIFWLEFSVYLKNIFQIKLNLFNFIYAYKQHSKHISFSQASFYIVILS